MPVPDFSAYKVVAGELSSATKQSNFVQAVQDEFGDIDTDQVTSLDVAKLVAGGLEEPHILTIGGTPVWVPRVLRKITTKDIVNTVAETDLLNDEITIPANAISTNRVLRLVLLGDYLNNSGSAQGITWRLKLGASTILGNAQSATQFASSANRRWARFTVEIGAQASNSIWAQLTGSVGNTTSPSVAGISTDVEPPGFQSATSGLQTINMAVAQTLKLTIVHTAANANLSIRCHYAVVEIV